MYVDESAINLAREANLFEFLRRTHSNYFDTTPLNLYLRGNNSLVIHKNNYGYIDYATQETGNGIDFLMRYLGYSFQEAVIALTKGMSQQKTQGISHSQGPDGDEPRIIHLPEPAPLPHSRMYAFLLKRRISKNLIDMLVSKGFAVSG